MFRFLEVLFAGSGRWWDARSPHGCGIGAVVLVTAVLIGSINPAWAQFEAASPVRHHTRSYHLAPGEESRSWSVTFELPEEQLRRGEVFICRRVFTAGDLEIVSESLVRNRYTISLHLARSHDSGGRGTLFLRLETGVPVETASMPAPTALGLASSPLPFVIEADQIGTHLAAAVFERRTGERRWQRVFAPNSLPIIDSGVLAVGGEYLLKVSQCDETVRQSPAACLAFRVEARRDVCENCHGTGHQAERTADASRAEPCPACDGIGGRFRPFPVVEAVGPDSPDLLVDVGTL